MERDKNSKLVLELHNKYHKIGMELRSRAKIVSDYNDKRVIDLQIVTNERFLTDIITLLVDLNK